MKTSVKLCACVRGRTFNALGEYIMKTGIKLCDCVRGGTFDTSQEAST